MSATAPSEIRYYDFRRHWTKRIVPHLGDEELNRILVRDMNRYLGPNATRKFEPGNVPHDFEGCDWWIYHRGPMPRYWRYVKHAACHWVVNFNLRLAMLAEPKRAWRILTSQKHSTVFDGDRTLFDINFSALGVEPAEAFRLAQGRELKPGNYRRVGTPERVA